jgi:hypothetical protein
MIEGTPKRGSPFKCQKSRPEHRLAFSCKVICPIRSCISFIATIYLIEGVRSTAALPV